MGEDSEAESAEGVAGGVANAQFSVYAFTDVGLRRRRNEDAVMVGGWSCQTHDGSLVAMYFTPAPPFVCAVADGMGGHAGGDIASRVALNVISANYRGWRSDQDVFDALLAVNDQVRGVGIETDLQGLGTTVAGLCFLSDGVIAFNVGDSRIYQIVSGEVRQLSVDDSIFDTNGKPTNIVTQSLGQPIPVRPNLLRRPLREATYLLCSDGVSGFMSDDELRDAVAPDHVGDWCARIVDTVRANGADDNFSFVIVDVTAI